MDCRTRWVFVLLQKPLSAVPRAFVPIMDDVHPIDDIDLDGKSRAKRIFVSLEPLPDKRIYRIDERGIETYEECVQG